MKRRYVKGALAMAGLLLAVFFAPTVYWRTAGTFRGEAFYDARPTTYWRQQIICDKNRRANAPVKRFGAPTTWHESLIELWQGWTQKDRYPTDNLAIDTEALAVLQELLRSDDAFVRTVAFENIVGHPESTRHLVAELVKFLMEGHLNCEENWGHSVWWWGAGDRRRQMFELSSIYGNEIVPPCCQLLDNQDSDSAMILIVVLSYHQNAEAAVPKLREVVKSHSSLEIRDEAARAIAKIEAGK